MPAIDIFSPHTFNTASCAEDAFAVTPSDAAELPYVVRQIYVGGGGDVKAVTAKGTTVTHKDVPAGGYISGLRIRKVLATGTTAASLVGYV